MIKVLIYLVIDNPKKMKIMRFIIFHSLVLFFCCQNEEYQDCHGTVGGGAYFDDCGDCVGGKTGSYECTTDCNGDLGGIAFINPCNLCVEGDTGLESDSCTSFEYNGKLYNTIIIGYQVWTSEDLVTEKYNNGNSIPAYQGSDSTGAFAKHVLSENNEKNAILYNWKVALNDSIAPEGWRVPNKNDFEDLINELGGNNLAGGKLKNSGFASWDFPNNFATNESGFSAIGKGFRDSSGTFQQVGKKCSFWTTDIAQTNDTTSSYLWTLKLSFDSNYADISPDSTNIGHPIRLIKIN
jgi:uncharacterized protein (TIGR02145 family)